MEQVTLPAELMKVIVTKLGEMPWDKINFIMDAIKNNVKLVEENKIESHPPASVMMRKRQEEEKLEDAPPSKA